MARRRKHRNAHRRARRSYRRSRRSRSYHRNPKFLPSSSFAMSIAAAALAYLAAEAASRQVRNQLPAAIPQPELVSAALSGIVLGFAANYLPVSASAKEAAQLGVGIPAVKALANAVGLGRVLGTAPIILVPGPSGRSALPAPLAAALEANLQAAFNGNMEDSYSPDY